MAKQGISTGSSPNDGSGDSLLQGAIKINSNFNEIYNAIGNGTNITNTIAFATTAYNINAAANINVGFATVYDLDVGVGGSSLIVTNDGIIAFGTNTTTYKLEIYKKPVRIHDSSVHFTGIGSVGIGTTNPTSKLQVFGGDIRVGIDTTSGLVLTSPNGTKFRLIVDNSGVLSTVQI